MSVSQLIYHFWCIRQISCIDIFQCNIDDVTKYIGYLACDIQKVVKLKIPTVNELINAKIHEYGPYGVIAHIDGFKYQYDMVKLFDMGNIALVSHNSKEIILSYYSKTENVFVFVDMTLCKYSYKNQKGISIYVRNKIIIIIIFSKNERTINSENHTVRNAA